MIDRPFEVAARRLLGCLGSFMFFFWLLGGGSQGFGVVVKAFHIIARCF